MAISFDHLQLSTVKRKHDSGILWQLLHHAVVHYLFRTTFSNVVWWWENSSTYSGMIQVIQRKLTGHVWWEHIRPSDVAKKNSGAYYYIRTMFCTISTITSSIFCNLITQSIKVPIQKIYYHHWKQRLLYQLYSKMLYKSPNMHQKLQARFSIRFQSIFFEK